MTTIPKVLIKADTMTEIMAAVLHKDADPNKPKIGAPFVTVVAKTQPRFVGGSPFAKGSVFKVAKVQVQLGVAYENAVNNQRSREGMSADFVADKRPWGTRVNGTPFVVHTPKGANGPRLYLDCKVHRSVEYRYETASGTPLDKAAVNKWVYRNPNANSRQGTDKETYWRNYPLDTVLGFIVNGTLYAVEDNMTLLSDLTAVHA